MASVSSSRGRKRKSQVTKEDAKTMKLVDEPSGSNDSEDTKKTKHSSTLSNSADLNRLEFKFYDRTGEELAKALLGQTLVRIRDGKRLTGKIVETEAYLGHIDKAAHSYDGKRTERTEAMFMDPGTAYVYNIYGMYCCMNISAAGAGVAVLLRALEPVENLETMDKLRTKGKEGTSLLKKNGVGLCNGPSKLCQALDIKKDTINRQSLCDSDQIWIEKGDSVNEDCIVKCKRININYAEDWVDKPLRFYILGNNCVSVKDKQVEKEMKT